MTEPLDFSMMKDDLTLTPVYPQICSETYAAYNSLFTKEHEIRFLEILEEEFKAADQ